MDCFALGIVEAFWHHVAKYHEDGDITGLKPGTLARSIRYTGDPAELLAAMVEAGFVDRLGERLIVHGWSEHADDATQSRLFRALQPFADGSVPKPAKIGKDERAELERQWANRHGSADAPSQVPAGSPPGPLPEPEPVPKPEPPAVLTRDGAPPAEEKPDLRLFEVPWYQSEEIPQPCRSALAEIATVPRFQKYLLAEPARSRTAIENLWPKARDAGMNAEQFVEAAEAFRSFYLGNRKHTDGAATFRDWVRRELERAAASAPKARGGPATVSDYKRAFDELGQVAQ